MAKIREGYVDSLVALIRRDSRHSVGANFVLWGGNFTPIYSKVFTFQQVKKLEKKDFRKKFQEGNLLHFREKLPYILILCYGM